MHGNSREVQSSQHGVHPRLMETVHKHLAGNWRRPYASHSLQAFETLEPWLAGLGARPLLLDSGCGTGASTLALARQYPDCAVLGIDQSQSRLARSAAAVEPSQHNLRLLRADLQDLWRLLHDAGVRPVRHLIWYPNPWPKPEHLGRRWHGHAVFPSLLALGGNLELRSNWRLYLDEFACALECAGTASVIEAVAANAEPVSPFERKYRDSGQSLWLLRADLPIQSTMASITRTSTDPGNA